MAVAKLSLFDPAGLNQLPDQSDWRAYARLLGRRELTRLSLLGTNFGNFSGFATREGA
jgi:hypothetical protein